MTKANELKIIAEKFQIIFAFAIDSVHQHQNIKAALSQYRKEVIDFINSNITTDAGQTPDMVFNGNCSKCGNKIHIINGFTADDFTLSDDIAWLQDRIAEAAFRDGRYYSAIKNVIQAANSRKPTL